MRPINRFRCVTVKGGFHSISITLAAKHLAGKDHIQIFLSMKKTKTGCLIHHVVFIPCLKKYGDSLQRKHTWLLFFNLMNNF